MTIARKLFTMMIAAGILAVGFSNAQADSGPVEKAGKAIDQVAEKVAKGVSKAVEKTGEALEKAGEKIQQVVKRPQKDQQEQ